MIPIGDWKPDQPAYGGSGTSLAQNVIPYTGGSYGPLPSAQPVTGAPLDSRVCGAIGVKDRNSNPLSYIGTKTKLYREVAGTHTDQSRGAGYNVGGPNGWEFATFGDSLFAASKGIRLQVCDYHANTAFADHPQQIDAPTVARIGEHLVVGAPNYAAEGNRPQRVQWSAFNDPLDFVPAPQTTGAGFQDLAGDYGEVVRVVGFEYGVIMRESAIHRMEPVGGDLIFSFGQGPVATNTGPISRAAVAVYGDAVMYLSHEGFMLLEQGYRLRAVGEGICDRTVLEDLNISRAGEISTAVDPRQQVVYWCYPSSEAPENVCDRVVLFNYINGRWSQADEPLDWLYGAQTGGIPTDSMSPPDWDYSDLMPDWALDEVATPDRREVTSYSTAHQRQTYNGPARTALVETVEAYMAQPDKTMLESVRPIVEGGDPEVALVHRDRMQETPTISPFRKQRPSGRVNHRKKARYFRARIRVAGGFRHIVGIEDVKGATAEWR